MPNLTAVFVAEWEQIPATRFQKLMEKLGRILRKKLQGRSMHDMPTYGFNVKVSTYFGPCSKYHYKRSVYVNLWIQWKFMRLEAENFRLSLRKSFTHWHHPSFSLWVVIMMKYIAEQMTPWAFFDPPHALLAGWSTGAIMSQSCPGFSWICPLYLCLSSV